MWGVELMWDKVLMFIFTCGFSYLFWKITQKEPNKIQFNFKFFLLYFTTSLSSFFVWPFFLLRPKHPRNVLVCNQIFKLVPFPTMSDCAETLVSHDNARLPKCRHEGFYIQYGGCHKMAIYMLSETQIGCWLPKHMTKLFGIKWILRNKEILEEDRGAVLVSNHQSALDILGLFNLWGIPEKMSVIAKKELFYVWPFGLAAYLAGIVFIDRSNAKNAYKTLQITSELMVKNKTKIWLFPEGTRNKDYTKFLPFKKGAFTMAVNAQVPLIPVVFSPYYFINQKKYLFNKGHVIIQFLEPIPTTGMTNEDVPKLIDTVYNKMLETYKELAKEVLSGLPEDYPYTTIG